MSGSCSLQLEVSWVPWTVREGRPKSTPGCQNTEALPHLPDVDLDCGDNFCYYYRCRKCLHKLALDNLQLSENLQGLRIFPEISCIQPKKENALFETDYGYHGEVAEFFINYLSRMDQLDGVAINSWSNCEARQILTNVDKTFDGTKYRGSSDFEIDWLIFTQSTLAVIEVGMRGESEPTEEKGKDSKTKSESERQQNLIKKKISQVLKDQVIVNHLMEATECYNLTILYLAVFPNLPLEEVEKIIKLYTNSLEALLTPNPSRITVEETKKINVESLEFNTVIIGIEWAQFWELFFKKKNLGCRGKKKSRYYFKTSLLEYLKRSYKLFEIWRCKIVLKLPGK